MAPPPPQEDVPLNVAEQGGDRVVVENGHGQGREELDELLGVEVRELEFIEHGGEGEEEDVYDEDVNAAERMVEDFGGFDPPLYIQRFGLENPYLLCII